MYPSISWLYPVYKRIQFTCDIYWRENHVFCQTHFRLITISIQIPMYLSLIVTSDELKCGFADVIVWESLHFSMV